MNDTLCSTARCHRCCQPLEIHLDEISDEIQIRCGCSKIIFYGWLTHNNSSVQIDADIPPSRWPSELRDPFDV